MSQKVSPPPYREAEFTSQPWQKWFASVYSLFDGYEEGDFVATGIGFVGTQPEVVCHYRKANGFVNIYVPAESIIGTSSSSTFYLVGLPDSITPQTVAYSALPILLGADNTAYCNMTGIVYSQFSNGTYGTIAFYKDNPSGVFTASGTKGLYTTEISYYKG